MKRIVVNLLVLEKIDLDDQLEENPINKGVGGGIKPHPISIKIRGEKLNKRKFSIITWTYTGIVVLIFGIYLAKNMDENWMIDLEGQRGNMYIFLGLLFIAGILGSIDFAGINEKSNKITKSTI